MLDAAALARTALDVELDSRSELTIEAGVSTFDLIGRFMGVPPGEEEQERQPRLPREVFLDALDELERVGVPVSENRDLAWEAFTRERGRYERMLFTLAGLVDAVATEWLPAELFDTHRPPVLRPHQLQAPTPGD